MWRRARPDHAASDKLCSVVLDRGYALPFLRVPPFVRNNAVPAGIAAGEESGVSGSGAGIGVIVVAVGEISAAIEKQAETAVAELIAIAFQVVAAELVNHDDHNELRMCVVSGREPSRDQAEPDQRHEKETGESHRALVYRRKEANRRGLRCR